jgi:NADH-quinone oxidoreductase subunit I
MSYFSNITNAVGTLVEGMKVTMGYFVRPREHVTLQYPDEVWPIPSRNIGVGELDTYNTIRSKLTVDMNDCIGCKACERACPVNCIHIDTYKGTPEDNLQITSNGTQVKLLVANFTIDMSECMFCDLCTPPCPEDCITMTPDYQFISNDNLKTDVTPEERWRDRDLLIYQFSKVSEAERQRRKAEAEEIAKAKAIAMAAKKAAAEKAAAEKATQEASVVETPEIITPEAVAEVEVVETIDIPIETVLPAETTEATETPVVPTQSEAESEKLVESEDSTTKESDNG